MTGRWPVILVGLGLVAVAATTAAAAAGRPPPQPEAAPVGVQAAPAALARSPTAMTVDELILQFKRPEWKAALRNTAPGAPARQVIAQALHALGQRHGVSLQYVQTLGVGSALVAVVPASAQLDALVARLAADPEVESVEVNARMTHMKTGAR